jgi:hypothetical protein
VGEAKRRSQAIKLLQEQERNWRASLHNEEQEIALIAERLYERLVKGRRYSGGCYHLAFFMTEFLERQNIIVTPVVGWVNDGTWDGVASHAWIEFSGKKTDVSLAYTDRPDAQPPGSVIILDFELRKGASVYTYYTDDHPEAQAALIRLRSNRELDAIRDHKEAEHQRMLGIAKSRTMMQHLSGAPAGLRYEDLVQLMK